MISIVHILNQFFAGLGGEEKADIPVGAIEGAAGAARALEAQLHDQARVIATIYFGDNYFHEHKNEAIAALLAQLEERRPDVIVAGPAFNAGRYGLACVEICQTIAERLSLPCVTGMEAENPGVSVYRDYHNEKIFLFPTAETAAGMARALSTMAPFAMRLAACSTPIGLASTAPSICYWPKSPANPLLPKRRWKLGAKCRRQRRLAVSLL